MRERASDKLFRALAAFALRSARFFRKDGLRAIFKTLRFIFQDCQQVVAGASIIGIRSEERPGHSFGLFEVRQRFLVSSDFL